jgi:hypothetical protein
MFCPQCGTNQADDLKFCKSCGANLEAVRQAVSLRESNSDKFDWSKSWVTEMFLSERERKRRHEELDRQRGITPEVKRLREIKAGIIVASIGFGISIFLFLLMEGIINGGNVRPADAAILSRIWAAGLIPISVGLGLIIAGLVVRTPPGRPSQTDSLGNAPDSGASRSHPEGYLPSAFSVTEGTTKHLNVSEHEK